MESVDFTMSASHVTSKGFSAERSAKATEWLWIERAALMGDARATGAVDDDGPACCFVANSQRTHLERAGEAPGGAERSVGDAMPHREIATDFQAPVGVPLPPAKDVVRTGRLGCETGVVENQPPGLPTGIVGTVNAVGTGTESNRRSGPDGLAACMMESGDEFVGGGDQPEPVHELRKRRDAHGHQQDEDQQGHEQFDEREPAGPRAVWGRGHVGSSLSPDMVAGVWLAQGGKLARGRRGCKGIVARRGPGGFAGTRHPGRCLMG